MEDEPRIRPPEDYDELSADSVHELLQYAYLDAEESGSLVDLPGGRETVVMRAECGYDVDPELIITHLADEDGHRYEFQLHVMEEGEVMTTTRWDWLLRDEERAGWQLYESETARISEEGLARLERLGYCVLFGDREGKSDFQRIDGQQITTLYDCIREFEIVEPGLDHRIYWERE